MYQKVETQENRKLLKIFSSVYTLMALILKINNINDLNVKIRINYLERHCQSFSTRPLNQSFVRFSFVFLSPSGIWYT